MCIGAIRLSCADSTHVVFTIRPLALLRADKQITYHPIYECSIMLKCPKCAAGQRHGSLFCDTCGAQLVEITAGKTERIQTTLIGTPIVPWGDDYFGDSITLHLRVGDKLIEVPLLTRIIIGRSAGEEVMRPDVDLSPFNAMLLGVSRMHAAIVRDRAALFLHDLNSTNHTWLNGNLVELNVQMPLHDGDEIRLGSFSMRVFYL